MPPDDEERWDDVWDAVRLREELVRLAIEGQTEFARRMVMPLARPVNYDPLPQRARLIYDRDPEQRAAAEEARQEEEQRRREELPTLWEHIFEGE